jgi:hypothetical protein
MGVLSNETLDLIPTKFSATNAGRDRIFGQIVARAQQAREDAGLCRMHDPGGCCDRGGADAAPLPHQATAVDLVRSGIGNA